MYIFLKLNKILLLFLLLLLLLLLLLIIIIIIVIIIIIIIIILFWSKAATIEGCSGSREWIPFIVKQFKGDQVETTRQMLVSITLLLLIFAGLNDQEFRNLISN